MRYIPEIVDRWQLIKAICNVLHSTTFIEGLLVVYPKQEGLVNFDIYLPLAENRGMRNTTFGKLFIPKAEIGHYFLERVTKDLPIRLEKQKIRFSAAPGRLNSYAERTTRILEKTRFVDPDLKQKRETVSSKLRDDYITIREVKIGVTYQDGKTKVFSSEFSFVTFGELWIDYENKLFRIAVSRCRCLRLCFFVVVDFDADGEQIL